MVLPTIGLSWPQYLKDFNCALCLGNSTNKSWGGGGGSRAFPVTIFSNIKNQSLKCSSKFEGFLLLQILCLKNIFLSGGEKEMGWGGSSFAIKIQTTLQESYKTCIYFKFIDIMHIYTIYYIV